jgi:hypothetical protein
MFENFDDLFDEFFGGKPRRVRKPKKDLSDFFKELRKEMEGDKEEWDRMKNLADKLNNFEDLHGEHMDNPHEKELGEPDEVITFEENGYVFEKRIWNLKHGQMVKVNMVFSPLGDNEGYDGSDIVDNFRDIVFGGKKRSLSEQLELAVKEERYEDAVAIRDKMKEAAKIRDEIDKRDSEPKKVEEDKPQQTLEDEDDEWNF